MYCLYKIENNYYLQFEAEKDIKLALAVYFGLKINLLRRSLAKNYRLLNLHYLSNKGFNLYFINFFLENNVALTVTENQNIYRIYYASNDSNIFKTISNLEEINDMVYKIFNNINNIKEEYKKKGFYNVL